MVKLSPVKLTDIKEVTAQPRPAPRCAHDCAHDCDGPAGLSSRHWPAQLSPQTVPNGCLGHAGRGDEGTHFCVRAGSTYEARGHMAGGGLAFGETDPSSAGLSKTSARASALISAVCSGDLNGASRQLHISSALKLLFRKRKTEAIT